MVISINTYSFSLDNCEFKITMASEPHKFYIHKFSNVPFNISKR